MKSAQSASSKAAGKSKQPTKAQLAAAAKANLEKPKDDHNIAEEQRVADRRADEQIKTDKKNAMDFAVQQLTTPVAGSQPQLKTPNAATEQFKKELAELQAKHGIVAPPAKPARADKIQSNGVTRPGAETLCGKIWAAADEISRNIHGVASQALLKQHPATQGVNEHTIKTQYARWRAFNGISGRLPTIHAVHQSPQGEYAEAMPNIVKPKE
jgi:hypothetical protein